MSFCYEVKRELCSVETEHCCIAAELYGSFLFCNTFSKTNIKLITESPMVVERISSHILRLFNFLPNIKKSLRKKGNIYLLTINDPVKLKIIHMLFGHDEKLNINHRILTNECCCISFLRGSFITGGTISSPEKSYYLDFTTPSLYLYKDMLTLFSEFDISPKVIIRKSNYVIYFKGSNVIEDLLQIMGASNSYFDFINVKIEKEIRNGVNRTINCDSANISRVLKASVLQTNAIKKLKKSGKLEQLDDELKELAKLRLENEELSLSELGTLMTHKLSKAAVYNRLKKLQDLSAELEKKNK